MSGIPLRCVFAVEVLKARLSSIENRTKEAVAQLAEMGGDERLMDRTAKYFELTAEEEEQLRRQEEAQLQEDEREEQLRRQQEEEAAQRERRLVREQRGREMAWELGQQEESVRQQERQQGRELEPVRQQGQEPEPVRQQGREPEPVRQPAQRRPSRPSSFWRQQEEELGEEQPQAAQNDRQPQQEQPRHQQPPPQQERMQQEHQQQEHQQQREEQEQPRQPVRAEGECRWLHSRKMHAPGWNAASVDAFHHADASSHLPWHLTPLCSASNPAARWPGVD